MEPVISNFDHLGADDIAGVRSPYGAEITFLPESVALRVGDAYSSDTYDASNSPSSYSATGLPPGLSIDSKTGHISGTATTSGAFGPGITAHGPITDAYGTFPMTVLGLEEIPGLLAILHLDAASVLADPIRPRIYAAGVSGISMIDNKTLQVTTLVAADRTGAHLSISADFSTLLYTLADKQEHRVDLSSLAVLPPIGIPNQGSAILEGLNNQAYVAGNPNRLGEDFVYQFDATTGALQVAFDPNPTPKVVSFAPLSIAISPDRKTLFVARAPPDGNLSSYDISGPVPVLLEQISGTFLLPTVSPDGSFSITNRPKQEYLLWFRRICLRSLRLLLSPWPMKSPLLPSARMARSTSLVTLIPGSAIFAYDPITLQLTSSLGADPRPAVFGYAFGQVAVNNTLFVPAGAYTNEVWVFSTDLTSLPPPPTPVTENLLNISTRARVEAGEDAMIGGFIVQGPDPKKVLIKGLGPCLPLTGALSDPVLDLYDSSGKLLASDDDWIAKRLDILGTQLAPSSEREASVLMTLQPGSYTAVVRDRTGQPGLGLVEIYDLASKDSLLANISTRGKVETVDNVMIGGFIIGRYTGCADASRLGCAPVIVRGDELSISIV